MERIMISRGKFFFAALALTALAPALASAANVRLAPQTKQVCVGKSATLVKLGTQAEYWTCNGRGSNQSTWQYRGSASTLTLDYATADVVAYCRQAGTDTYDLSWKLAYQDMNVYSMNYTVNCVVCPRPVPVPRPVPRAGAAQLRGNVAAARGALLRNDYGSFGMELHRAELFARELGARDRFFVNVAVRLRAIEGRLESRNRALLLGELNEVDRMLAGDGRIVRGPIGLETF